jgi:hypothetical protein
VFECSCPVLPLSHITRHAAACVVCTGGRAAAGLGPHSPPCGLCRPRHGRPYASICA